MLSTNPFHLLLSGGWRKDTYTCRIWQEQQFCIRIRAPTTRAVRSDDHYIFPAIFSHHGKEHSCHRYRQKRALVLRESFPSSWYRWVVVLADKKWFEPTFTIHSGYACLPSQRSWPSQTRSTVLLQYRWLVSCQPTLKEWDWKFLGIHGLPLAPWPQKNPDPKKEFWYCAHQKVVFSTWHTPCMLLFEQRMYEEMCDIVKSQFSADSKIKEQMQRAADAWRLPFWDWARRRPNWD